MEGLQVGLSLTPTCHILSRRDQPRSTESKEAQEGEEEEAEEAVAATAPWLHGGPGRSAWGRACPSRALSSLQVWLAEAGAGGGAGLSSPAMNENKSS